MRTRVNRKLIIICLLIIMAFAVKVSTQPALVKLGEVLISEDEVQKSSVIVVLQGEVPDRIVHGVELWHQRFAERIVMVRSHDFNNYQLMDELKLDAPGQVDINKDLAVQLDIPVDNIHILDGRADSTWDEALIIREFVMQEQIDSLILVTSKYHSARAHKIFERVLGDDVKVISSPSAYDPYNPEDWWQDRRHARQTLFEYLKFMNFYLFQRE